jgi:hypothetical protein
MDNKKKGIGIFIAAIMVISVFGITMASAVLLPPPQTGNLFVLEEGSDDVISITPTGRYLMFSPRVR